MKISKIIDELTELKEYIGDKDLHECIVNDVMTSVNVMYLNDNGGWTSTSLEGEKMARQIKEAPNKIKVKVLKLDFCDSSIDPELVAMADVEVTNESLSITLNDLSLRYNDITKEYSIVEPEVPSGVCINEFICRAVTSAVADHYIHSKHTTIKSNLH